MNPEQSERVHRWIERLGEELTIEATMDPADVEAILDAAKAAAHNVERPAAPTSPMRLVHAPMKTGSYGWLHSSGLLVRYSCWASRFLGFAFTEGLKNFSAE